MRSSSNANQPPACRDDHLARSDPRDNVSNFIEYVGPMVDETVDPNWYVGPDWLSMEDAAAIALIEGLSETSIVSPDGLPRPYKEPKLFGKRCAEQKN